MSSRSPKPKLHLHWLSPVIGLHSLLFGVRTSTAAGSDVFADVIYRFANHITSTTGSGRDGLGVSKPIHGVHLDIVSLMSRSSHASGDVYSLRS